MGSSWLGFMVLCCVLVALCGGEGVSYYGEEPRQETDTTDQDLSYYGEDAHEDTVATDQDLSHSGEDTHEDTVATDQDLSYYGEDAHEETVATDPDLSYYGEDAHEETVATDQTGVSVQVDQREPVLFSDTTSDDMAPPAQNMLDPEIATMANAPLASDPTGTAPLATTNHEVPALDNIEPGAQFAPGLASTVPEGETNSGDEADVCSGPCESFLMGFVGHSGSSAIMSTLWRHSMIEIPWPMEPLQKARSSAMAAQMTRVKFDASIEKGLKPGFKLRPGHVLGAADLWNQLVSSYKTRLIVLTRDNCFKAAIGLYTIRARFDLSAQQGLSAKEAETHCKENPESCYYDVTNLRFFAYLMHISKHGMNQVLALRDSVQWPCVLHVTYEDYVRDNEEVMNKIYDFLGLEAEDNTPRFEKALSDSPCVVLKNYQEVCADLWGCEELRPYLEDEEHGCVCNDKSREPDPVLCSYKSLMAQGPLVCHDIDQFGNPRAVACLDDQKEEEQ